MSSERPEKIADRRLDDSQPSNCSNANTMDDHAMTATRQPHCHFSTAWAAEFAEWGECMSAASCELSRFGNAMRASEECNSWSSWCYKYLLYLYELSQTLAIQPLLECNVTCVCHEQWSSRQLAVTRYAWSGDDDQLSRMSGRMPFADFAVLFIELIN